MGRFISRDPIKLSGGSNIYAYSLNPITWVDVLGLAASTPHGKVWEKSEAKISFEMIKSRLELRGNKLNDTILNNK